jgi:starch phosphorylase
MPDTVSFQSVIDKSVSGLWTLVQNHLKFSLARDAQTASKRDWWLATSKAVQSVIIERMIATQGVHHRENAKRVYYLSLEFLMGRLFSNSLYSAGIFEEMEAALKELGFDVETLRLEEYDMALATASITNTAFSNRSSATATRWNCPTSG